jgi:ribosomal protein S20
MASAKPKKKNPRLASGRKRVRQDVKLNAANTSLRSKYRTAVKNVEKAVLAGDKTKATELFAKMQVRGRHRRRQGHLPQEQGRSRQEPPVCQGQGPGTAAA